VTTLPLEEGKKRKFEGPAQMLKKGGHAGGGQPKGLDGEKFSPFLEKKKRGWKKGRRGKRAER